MKNCNYFLSICLDFLFYIIEITQYELKNRYFFPNKSNKRIKEIVIHKNKL